MTKKRCLAIIYKENKQKRIVFMAKLCIFDLDGTLTNTIPAISHFGNTALSQFGFPQIDPERYKLHVGNGRDFADI